MTGTIQQNEETPSSHLGFRSGRPYLNEREKVLVKELVVAKEDENAKQD